MNNFFYKIKDLDERTENELLNEIDNKEYIYYKYQNENDNFGGNINHDGPWKEMYKLLDEISLKLEWPSFEAVDNKNNTMDKINYFLKLKETIKTNTNKYDIDFQNKLNKQIAFYGLSVFFQKLIEFNLINENFYSHRIILTISSNDIDQNMDYDNENENFLINYVHNLISFLLNVWHQLNNNNELFNIITKCLNNCKLDNNYYLKQFVNNFYTIYKYNLINNNESNENSIHFQAQNSFNFKLQYIAVLLLEKNLIQVSVLTW